MKKALSFITAAAPTASIAGNVYISDNVRVAGDVNGDRVTDDTDIETILDYSLLYGDQEDPEVSFEEYIIGLINE